MINVDTTLQSAAVWMRVVIEHWWRQLSKLTSPVDTQYINMISNQDITKHHPMCLIGILCWTTKTQNPGYEKSPLWYQSVGTTSNINQPVCLPNIPADPAAAVASRSSVWVGRGTSISSFPKIPAKAANIARTYGSFTQIKIILNKIPALFCRIVAFDAIIPDHLWDVYNRTAESRRVLTAILFIAAKVDFDWLLIRLSTLTHHQGIDSSVKMESWLCVSFKQESEMSFTLASLV